MRAISAKCYTRVVIPNFAPESHPIFCKSFYYFVLIPLRINPSKIDFSLQSCCLWLRCWKQIIWHSSNFLASACTPEGALPWILSLLISFSLSANRKCEPCGRCPCRHTPKWCRQGKTPMPLFPCQAYQTEVWLTQSRPDHALIEYPIHKRMARCHGL